MRDVVKSPRSVIMVRCLSCQHHGIIAEHDLVRFRLKPGAPIAQFVKRLRFKTSEDIDPGTYLGLSSFQHPCMGTTVMDRNNRIGRRKRREILKSIQGLAKVSP